MLVTDVKRHSTKLKKEVTGYYMDGLLRENLDGVQGHLKKKWDAVGIVSGHGLVGVGKSTLAMQVAYYLAWKQAGGSMTVRKEKHGWVIEKITPPIQPVKFSLEENVVFSAEDLQETAGKLYKKYGPGQVIVYDEGRQGLDSSRAMESVNKGMEDFFQENRVYNQIIIIVLPNFFKLHEDYAVSRSLFLIDVFHDKKLNRGYFNFYNRTQKEWLYFLGKKKIGITMKYSAGRESFWGRFYRWLPFDKDLYEKAKTEAIEKKRLSRGDRRIRMQRDILFWILLKEHQASV